MRLSIQSSYNYVRASCFILFGSLLWGLPPLAAQSITPKLRVNSSLIIPTSGPYVTVLGNDANGQRSVLETLKLQSGGTISGLDLLTGESRFSISTSSNVSSPKGLFFDVDGDGFDEFATNEFSTVNNGTNTIQIRSGADGSVLTEIPLSSQGSTARFGIAEDLNGNGSPEVVTNVVTLFPVPGTSREIIDPQSDNSCRIINHSESMNYLRLARDFTNDPLALPDVLYMAKNFFGAEIRILDLASCSLAGTLISNASLIAAGVQTLFGIINMFYDPLADQVVIVDKVNVHIFDVTTGIALASAPIHSDPSQIAVRAAYDKSNGILLVGTLEDGVAAAVNTFIVTTGQIIAVPGHQRTLEFPNATSGPEYFYGLSLEQMPNAEQRYKWLAVTSTLMGEQAYYEIEPFESSPVGPSAGPTPAAVTLTATINQGVNGSIIYNITGGVPGAVYILHANECSSMPSQPLPGIHAFVNLEGGNSVVIQTDGQGDGSFLLTPVNTISVSGYQFCIQAATAVNGVAHQTNAVMIKIR